MTLKNYNHVETLLHSNLALYRNLAISQGVPPDADDYIYGQAMSHVLFDIYQSKNSVGVFGTLSGKVKKLKEQFMIEVVPMAHMNSKVREKFFIEYCLWSRMSDCDIDLEFLESSFRDTWEKFGTDQRYGLLNEANQFKFKWLDLMER